MPLHCLSSSPIRRLPQSAWDLLQRKLLTLKVLCTVTDDAWIGLRLAYAYLDYLGITSYVCCITVIIAPCGDSSPDFHTFNQVSH